MAEALKHLWNPQSLAPAAQALRKAFPAFPEKAFLKSVFSKEWESLELKQRLRHIAVQLHAALDMEFPEAAKIIRKAAPETEGFVSMFYPDFVEVFGKNHFDVSMKLLHWLTRFSSSEFAVRPFILDDPERAFNYLYKWAEDENHHVRRLASEGSRPRLPWAMALPFLKKDPSPTLPILEKLKADTSEYVRRSVANHLNDISKDHPALALKLGKKWAGQHPETDKVVKHALRTLLKKGDAAAMQLFGFGGSKDFEIPEFSLHPKRVPVSGTLEFAFGVRNASRKVAQVRIEYAITFARANDKNSRKVFFITETELKPGELRSFVKKQKFHDLTTRKHYAGKHTLHIILNGEEKVSADFLLTDRK